MKTFYNYLNLELGVSFQPLQALYSRFLFLATHSWMKMLWEKMDKFGVTIKTARGPLAFPRQEGKFLMLVLMERGHSRDIIRQLNRVRVHVQVLFLSDALTVSGNTALQPWLATDRLSVLNYSKEKPTLADMIIDRNCDVLPIEYDLLIVMFVKINITITIIVFF